MTTYKFWTSEFYTQPTGGGLDDGDRTVGEAFQDSFRFIPWGGGFRTVGASGAGKAAATKVAAQAGARSWWKPALIGGGAVAIGTGAGPWLGREAGETGAAFIEAASEGIGNAIKPLAGPLLLVGVGFLAYTFLTSPRSAK